MAKRRTGDEPRSLADKLIDDMIAARQRLYETQGDPLRVWEAFLCARLAGRAIPAWVLEYLDRAGRALNELSRTEPPWDQLPRGVLRALEITRPGRGTIFSRRDDAELDTERARYVAALIADGVTRSRAIEVTAEHLNSSRSEVERAYSAAKARGGPEPAEKLFSLRRAQFPDGVPDGSTIEVHEGRAAGVYVVRRTVEQDDRIINVVVMPKVTPKNAP